MRLHPARAVEREFEKYFKASVDAVDEKRLSDLPGPERAAFKRRLRELHPSSFPYCGYRHAYEHLVREEDPVVYGGFQSEYYVNVGSLAHLLFQKWLGVQGQIAGDWKCISCGHRHKLSLHPEKCKACGHRDLAYEEVGGKWGKRIRWHKDGLFIDKKGRRWIVDYKGLALTTKLPTPTGWTTMGEVKVGDQLLDSKGRPCTVTGKSEVHKRNCYKIKFDDGSSVVCDDEHLWVTTHGRSDCNPKTEVLNTEQIKATLKDTHRIKLAESLKLPKRNLPIDPYVLGCWLGDGTASNGVITKPDFELFENIEACGYETQQPPNNKTSGKCHQRNVIGLSHALRMLGVRDNKHIPIDYLRSSAPQRLALLQGLMDTDGSYNELRKQAVFSTVDRKFAEQVKELICSLGQRGVNIEITARGFGKVITAYHVRFRPVNGLNPFRLSRKANKVVVTGNDVASRQRVIKSITKVKAVPTQCLEVDSPDHTYLCTTWMIPTHNTSGSSKIWDHKKKGNVFPYPSNKFQIESYVPLAEDAYGEEIYGTILIYVSRDFPTWNYAVVANVISAERKEELRERLTRDDATFGIVLNLKENPEHIGRLRKRKLCVDRDFYNDNVHSSYDPCPLADHCFSSKRSEKVFTQAFKGIPIVVKEDE